MVISGFCSPEKVGRPTRSFKMSHIKVKLFVTARRLEVINKKRMAEEKNQDLEFVEYVVKALVDNPDKVKAERTIDEMGVLISLHVDPADMGQVIGRQGQTAKSIRTLLKVVGAKSNARVNLKIIEPEGSTRPPKPAATAAVEEDATDVVEDLKL